MAEEIEYGTCRHCLKQIYHDVQINGRWYHDYHTFSFLCKPDGTHRAEPIGTGEQELARAHAIMQATNELSQVSGLSLEDAREICVEAFDLFGLGGPEYLEAMQVATVIAAKTGGWTDES